MKRHACSLMLSAGVVLLSAMPAQAHHSFPAQYDIDKPITLTVKVTKVEWTNPHIFIYGDVSDGDDAGVHHADHIWPSHRGHADQHWAGNGWLVVGG